MLKTTLKNIIKRPHLYIYEKNVPKENLKYIYPKKGYVKLQNKELLIYADSTWFYQNFK